MSSCLRCGVSLLWNSTSLGVCGTCQYKAAVGRNVIRPTPPSGVDGGSVAPATAVQAEQPQAISDLQAIVADLSARLRAREDEIQELKDRLARRDEHTQSERQPAAASNEMRTFCDAEGSPRTVRGGVFQEREREEWTAPVVCTLEHLHDGPHIAEDVYGQVVGAWYADRPDGRDPAFIRKVRI